MENKRKMIDSESTIMYKLRECPYIVTYEEEDMRELYINGKFEGYYFLIRMELLENVYKLIDSGRFDLSEANVIKLAKEIGQGIKAAHNIGVIHRDIKPANFFVSKDGVYKLGDFNISKKTVSAHSFAGTEGYIAPEVYRAKSNIDDSYTAKADIYSLGICLYQMMNDVLFPFEEKYSIEDAIDERMKGKVLSAPKHASLGFGRIILKACAFDTSERYQTMDEMLNDLYNLEGNGRRNLINKEDRYKTVYAGNPSANETVYADKQSIKVNSDESEIFKDFEIVDGILKRYVGNCNLTEITIPYGVTRIESEAFSGNTNLYKIHIPESVISIGEYAFLNCSSLYEIKLPYSLSIIEKGAFQNCSKLKAIRIPSGVTKIFSQTFKGCKNLSLIDISDCSIVFIGKEAFAASGLTSITLPDSVKNIEERAFYQCDKLKTVRISNALESIKGYTFAGCSSLKNLIIPNTLKYIGEYAFNGCAMSNLTIPKSVKEISEGSFQGCYNLNITLFKTTKFHKYTFGYKPKSISVLAFVFDEWERRHYKEKCKLPITCNSIIILHKDGTQEQYECNQR